MNTHQPKICRMIRDMVHFRFDWTWIKDKGLIHQGNREAGYLLILDAEDNLIKALAYELVPEE